MILGIDPGNFAVKIANENGVYQFPSCLGEWRKRNLSSTFGEDDMEFEFEGQKGFAGTLAKFESEFLRNMMGSTKAHEDAKLRVLLAVHRFGSKHNHIVVGQPIIQHKEEEKQKIKRMLQGTHTMTINGVTKTFTINRVEVAAEGGAVYWALNSKVSLIRIIEIGSGTVNCATIIDGRYVDRDSSTIEFGAESTKSRDNKRMADSIIAHTSGKWQKDDVVFVAGGIAESVLPHLKNHYKDAHVVNVPFIIGKDVTFVPPVYANAVAFYNIARGLYK